MKKLFLTASLILCMSALLSAQQHKGKSLYQYGDSSLALGRAGTGVAAFGTDLFYLNPASVADAERLGISAQYGTLPLQTNYYNPDISLAVPTSYGTAAFSYRYFNFPEAAQFDSGGIFSIGGARDFTDRVMLGLAFNIFYGSADGNGIFYFGATLGSIYKIKKGGSEKGFGIHDTNAGIALNIGIPAGDGSTYSNFNNLTLGLTSTVYKGDVVSYALFSDISAIDFYSAYPVKLGIQADIKEKFILRAGTVLPVRDSYDYGDYTLGAGYRFNDENYSATVNYAFNHYRDNVFVHYVGATLEYGKLDRSPPVTGVAPDLQYISPNSDGVQDQVFFATNVKDESRISGWKLQITDADGQVVKEFKNSDRVVNEKFTMPLFFDRLTRRKESISVPEKIMWDGNDSESNLVPDGRYAYAFHAWDERGNISDKKSGTVFVDVTAPAVQLEVKERLFSPNGDNQKDEFIITQNIKSAPEDDWNAGFKDTSGKVVKSYKWKGDSVPAKLVWDGKDDEGKDAAEGLYNYFISSSDKAGNSGVSGVNNITLTRAYETADVNISSEYFSHKSGKPMKFSTALSNKKGLESWNVSILDSKKKPVKEFTGKTDLPEEISWNGKDADSKDISDGIYFVRFASSFESGNTPASFDKKFIVDSTPPKIEISHSPDIFSPDNDGENDILTIQTSFKEDFGMKSWSIRIFESSGEPFKSFSGTGDIPSVLLWDGLGDSKELVESASDYYMHVEAFDMAGNLGVSNKDRIAVDILVILTERGLKMQISNIQFDFDSDKLKKPSIKVLDRVYDILDKYEHYNIEVEGHTDDIGTEEYNLKLSERRANSVKNYLIKKGVVKKRISSIGRGKSTPMYEVSSEKNKKKLDEKRRRNRRVEFLLIRIN
jgi:outer membrane protein OmpA-like peptidoglycan-associated protein/flagellar hook assembly protein FlgD